MNAKALANCEIAEGAGSEEPWREQQEVMAFLRTLWLSVASRLLVYSTYRNQRWPRR